MQACPTAKSQARSNKRRFSLLTRRIYGHYVSLSPPAGHLFIRPTVLVKVCWNACFLFLIPLPPSLSLSHLPVQKYKRTNTHNIQEENQEWQYSESIVRRRWTRTTGRGTVTEQWLYRSHAIGIQFPFSRFPSWNRSDRPTTGGVSAGVHADTQARQRRITPETGVTVARVVRCMPFRWTVCVRRSYWSVVGCVLLYRI